MRLQWNLTDTEILGSIEGSIGDGWMAIGIALGSEFYMTSDGQGTDAIVGAMRDDGSCNTGCIRDYWIYAYAPPRLDTSQDVQFVGANRTGNHVTLHFKRLLTTADTTEDRAINTTFQRINWAYSTNKDALSSNGTLLMRHENQGTLLLNLTATSQCVLQTQTNAFSNHDGSYRAEWLIDETAGTITVTAKAKTKGWVGFGINTKPGMVGGDVIVGWIGPNNRTVVQDRTATRTEMPVLDTSLSNGVDDVTNAQAYTELIDGATFTVISFTRQLVTNDPNDIALIDGEPTPTYLMWAFGGDDSIHGDRFDRHVDAGSEQVNFFDGCVSAPRLAGYALEKAHGILMVVGWFCFLPIGMFASRYMKTMTPRWFPTHVALQTIGVAMIIISFILIVVEHDGGIHVGPHQIIGVIVFTATLSLPILGIIADRMFNSKRKVAPVFPDKIHWWVGRLTFLAAIVNVFLGIWQFSVYSFLLWIFAAAWVILSVVVLIVQERRVGQTHEQGYNEVDLKSDSESSGSVLTTGTGKRALTKKEQKGNLTTFIVYVVLSAGLVLAFSVVLGITQPFGERLFDTDGQLCMRFEQYEVQPTETAYICRGFMFPQDRPYHVLKFEPILDNPALVHHMILYSVPEFVDKEYFPCGETPPGAFPLYAWAVGMDPFETPENVGFRVGQDAVTQYIVLEIHYNNPEKTAGIIDSSGVRMTMTADLRPIDAGIFVLGVNTGDINIPADTEVYELTSTCSEKQTGSLPPAKKINALVDDYVVFSSGLHMHQHGRQIYTEQLRDNQKIGSVGCNDYFDFQRQKFTPVSVTLKPGDKFVTHCVWNTTGSAQNVRGCESTACEMCLNYIAYYPQIPGGGGSCVGRPDVVNNPVRRQNCPAN
jgi:hypothetical protein